MKKYFAAAVLLLMASACLAVDYSGSLSIKTGDASLDLSLKSVNDRAASPSGAGEVKTEIRQNFSLSDREISFLSKKGYTLAEIYYFASLAKQSWKPVSEVAALRSKGIGWGVMAKRLGVQPSALRKLMVREMKKEKMMVKERKMEMKMEPRMEPKPSMMKERETPRMMERGPAGGGGGRGSGRGRGR